METDKNIESVEIFTGIIWQAEMVKNLLENADIKAYLTDEIIGALELPWNAPGGIGSVKVLVSNFDYDKAKLIVEEYKKNLKEK